MKNKHLKVALPPPKTYSSKGFSGFTLAETLIVLVVLGIVASLTIPPLVRRQIEAANRVKIKKAMGVYDTLLAKIAVENDIKSNAALKEWGEQGGECANQRNYFKVVKGDGCQFMTADKVWLDVSDITHIKIALKEDELDNPDSKTTFQLLGHFGPNGELRVNDIQWEISSNDDLTDEEKEELEKLFGYLNNEKQTEEEIKIAETITPGLFDHCKSWPCKVTYSCPTAYNSSKTCIANFSQQEFDTDYDFDMGDVDCYIDTDTCNYIETNSKSIAGKYKTVNIGGRIDWDDADSECKKIGSNFRVATVAELQRMKKTNSIKCSDGSIGSCRFWTLEETTNGLYGVDYDLYTGNIGYDEKDYSDYSEEVLCIGKDD